MEVTLICTIRPEVLRASMESFVRNVCYGYPIDAVINVDPVPTVDEKQIQEMTRIVDGVFSSTKWRFPDVPNFSEAVRWTWANTKDDYVLHLEDDWEWLHKVNLEECVRKIESGECDFVRFPKRSRPIEEEQSKVGLSPGLWKGETVRELAKYININHDPEKQLRFGVSCYGIDEALPKKIWEYPDQPVVRDIGRKWRDEHGFDKWDKRGPVTWIKK